MARRAPGQVCGPFGALAATLEKQLPARARAAVIASLDSAWLTTAPKRCRFFCSSIKLLQLAGNLRVGHAR